MEIATTNDQVETHMLFSNQNRSVFNARTCSFQEMNSWKQSEIRMEIKQISKMVV